MSGFDLKNTRGDNLRLYMFTMSPNEVIMVMAYSLDGANRDLMKSPVKACFTYAGDVLISSIIGKLNLDHLHPILRPLPASRQVQIKVDPDSKFNSFKASLMLLTDEFIRSKRDKAEMRRIIGKLKNKKTS